MPFFEDPRLNPPEQPDGVVAVSELDALGLPVLTEAYRLGIFPWPHAELEVLPWFCPPERGVIVPGDLHQPRSLRTWRRGAGARLKVTWGQAFAAVIAGCAAVPRAGQDGTWITPELARAYLELHRAGLAQSVEVWDGSRLVGGLYGVGFEGFFSAESMFHLVPNASKLALCSLLETLGEQGLPQLDIQMVTPVTESLGARLIPRAEFLDRLADARARARRGDLPRHWRFPLPRDLPPPGS